MQEFSQTGYEMTIIYYRFSYYSSGRIKNAWQKMNKLEFSEKADMRRRVKEVSPGPDYYFYTRDRIPTVMRYGISSLENFSLSENNFLASRCKGFKTSTG